MYSAYTSAEVRFYGNRGNRQILQTRRTNPYSRLFHRKFSDGLIMK